MTNEELAIEIKTGNKSACAQLWEQVRYFIKKTAFRYYNALQLSGREYIPDADDFISEGYIAMLEAVKYYSPEKDYRYITYLNKTLKKAFAAVAGLRTSKMRNEPLNNSGSLNMAVTSESDDMEFIDLIADETVQNEFDHIEISETQQIVAEAISELIDSDRQLIKMRYWDEFSYETIGTSLKITGATVKVRERRILRKLRMNDNLYALYNAFKLHYDGIEIENGKEFNHE